MHRTFRQRSEPGSPDDARERQNEQVKPSFGVEVDEMEQRSRERGESEVSERLPRFGPVPRQQHGGSYPAQNKSHDARGRQELFEVPRQVAKAKREAEKIVGNGAPIVVAGALPASERRRVVPGRGGENRERRHYQPSERSQGAAFASHNPPGKREEDSQALGSQREAGGREEPRRECYVRSIRVG